ncbi:trehalose-phosphatase [Thioalkalivibrio thiocyanoxidans]|uniref:trehalose-phosphatase n=1 Tax=Thioalkalivibrio thiocyanoxidans TaxID=152475 RepID=UPI00039AFF97|nr:trehalose-phosphatase [Thioalkalivibrio thiocyanoxidans]
MSRTESVPAPMRVKGVVFDMDGVITDTAEAHAAAWKRMFDEALPRIAPGQEPFDAVGEYRLHVDGKPRLEGLADFLAARGIELPRGELGDAPGTSTLHALGNLKNRYFREWLDEHPVAVFPGSRRLLGELRAAGVRCGVFTSSRNGRRVLESAGITDLFDAIIDGEDAAADDLPGKPAPDLPVACAEALGVAPDEAALVEDAPVGIEAGQRGGFALLVGIDRSRDHGERYREAGAQVVISDCAALRLGDTGLAVATLDALPTLEDAEALLREHLEERRPALFLDYDGTLSPIVEDPDAAVLSAPMREVLARLAGCCPLAVISGRDLDDVRRRVDLEDAYYSGSHGFEVAGPDGFHERLGQGEHYLDELDDTEAALQQALEDAGMPGVQLERKTFSLAVHVRRAAAEDAERTEELVREILDRHPGLALSHGKKVFQAQPRTNWHKGRAVHWLLRRLDLDRDDVLPIYLGDDITDEDAFEALAGTGLGIAVRGEEDRPTAADLALDDTEGVRRFLEVLARLLNARGNH